MCLVLKNGNYYGKLFFSVIIILLLSNLTLKTLVPSFVVNAFAIGSIALIQCYCGLKNGIVFFVAQLLILSNFTYGNNQCGLYNLTTFVALVLLISSSKSWRISTKTKNIKWIVLLFFINVLGYLIHPVEFPGIIQGLITFSSFTLIFLLISDIELKLVDIGFIFKGLMIVQAYALLISVLKLVGLFDASLPMFGGGARIGSMT